jgi:anti-sigma regulatory factor (Ser/Thr protein kinase)
VAETLRLDLGLDAPRRARTWIARVCRANGYGDVADDAALLVSELVTNAVLHARTGCTILVEFGDRAIRAHVVDLDETDVLVRVPGEAGEGGRGLNIVAAVASEWGVTPQRTGKSVWFTLTSADGAQSSSALEDRGLERPADSA